MKKLFLLLTVFLIGCSSPKVGNWYENVESRHRYKLLKIENPQTLISDFDFHVKNDVGNFYFKIRTYEPLRWNVIKAYAEKFVVLAKDNQKVYYIGITDKSESLFGTPFCGYVSKKDLEENYVQISN
jgi:hypothetical protein